MTGTDLVLESAKGATAKGIGTLVGTRGSLVLGWWSGVHGNESWEEGRGLERRDISTHERGTLREDTR